MAAAVRVQAAAARVQAATVCRQAAFTLVEEGRDGSERKLGTERFDLSAFADATSVPKPLDLSLAGGKAP